MPPLSAIFVEETGYSEKTTELPLVTDKLYHMILYRVHSTMSAIHTHNFGGDEALISRPQPFQSL
jgi:hypothetical protein